MAKIRLSASNWNYDAEFIGNGKGFRLIGKGFFGKMYSAGLSLLELYTQNGRGKTGSKKLRYPIIPEESIEDSLDANMQIREINLNMLDDHPGDPRYSQQISDEIIRSWREVQGRKS